MLRVLPLQMYCKEFGVDKTEIERLIASGVWIYGKHIRKVENVRERWIDLDSVESLN